MRVRFPDYSMITNHDILDLLADAVQSGAGVRIPVTGRSMGPAFAQVTEIVVKPAIPSQLKVGHIVVVQRDGLWVVHRIMWRRRGRFITKGDGLGQLDRPWVVGEAIKGVVVGLGLKDGSTCDLCTVRSRLKGLASVLKGWGSLWLTLS